ncbi:MAG TPA: hypothetical protein VIK91_28070 [Nannocystis sp.]
MDPRHGQGFGWSVACPAESEEGAARHVEGVWESFFPPDCGYAVTRARLYARPSGRTGGGPQQPTGVRLQVRRGDFCGEVEVMTTMDDRRPLLWLRGHAGSLRLAAVELAAARATERLRLVGMATGLSALAALCVELMTHPPGFTVDMMFFLGGLLVAVIVVIGVAIGSSVGAWLGERSAALGYGRALAVVERDAALHEDLRRFRALVRNLAHYRDALAGSARRLPFRSLHPAAEVEEEMSERTGSREGA